MKVQYLLKNRSLLLMQMFITIFFLMITFSHQLKAEETKSWWEIILQVSGISANPSSQKGLGDINQKGALWVVNVKGESPVQIIEGDKFHSPVFTLNGKDVLALDEEQVVQIRVSGIVEHARSLFSVKGITKLIGVNKENSDQVLVLIKNEQVAMLSLLTGKVTHKPYQSSPEMTRLLNHLRGWSREYKNIQLYVRRETKEDMAGTVEWTDVYFKKGSESPINISRCGGTNCSQPSLSLNRSLVVFIKETKF